MSDAAADGLRRSLARTTGPRGIDLAVEDIPLPQTGSPEHDRTTKSGRYGLAYDTAIAGAILTLFCIIFAFDAVTPADHVSICFLYAIPIFVSVFGNSQPVFVYALLGTALSLLGTFIQPPAGSLESFYGNRAVAVAVLWITASLIATRQKAHALIAERFEEEKRKSEYRRRFLDVLSHEIGTSLTTIDGQAFRLRKIAANSDSPDIRSRAEKIRNAVQHIKSVVHQVQLASEAGQRALQPQCCSMNLRRLVEEAAQHVRESGAAAQALTTDLDGLPETIWGDPYMLRQVVDNLISNAIKYSPPDSPIRVTGRRDPGVAVISVTDCGRGIPADEQPLLFGPYYRASNSRGVHGAGIGLFVCERFVASHGGTIAIESSLGQGATVTVRLPTGRKSAMANDARRPDDSVH